MTSTTQAPHRDLRRRRRVRRALIIVVVLALIGWLADLGWNALFGGRAVVDSCQVVGVSTGNVYSLTPEQLLNASIITDVAMRRNLPTRASLIALATAYQESKMRNLDYGDADSLGLFQQRTSQGWGSPQQIMTPTYAAGKFYDALLRVPRWESLPVTQAAQAVQRSAFPDAYSRWESPATALSAALTGDTLGQLSCRLAHPGVITSGNHAATLDASATAVVQGLGSDLEVTSATVATGGSRERVVTVGGLAAPSSGGDAAAKRRTATVAAWVIAHAKTQGITRVIVGDREWKADRKGWHSTKQAAPAGTVVLTVGAR